MMGKFEKEWEPWNEILNNSLKMNQRSHLEIETHHKNCRRQFGGWPRMGGWAKEDD